MGQAFDHKHVLFADDDPASRRLVEKMLRSGAPGVQVTCVGDGAQALAVLDREPVDLLITDLAMPVLGGVELILQVIRRHLSVSLLVVSGQKDPQAESRALLCGALAYFEKPLRSELFVSCVCNLLTTGSRPAPLEVVSLAGLARIISMERKTCALRVTLPDQQGLLMFVAGELVDARQGELDGLAAAQRILAWNAPSVALEPLVHACKQTIDTSLSELLRTSADRRCASGVVAARGRPPTLPGPAPDFRARRAGEQPTPASPGSAASAPPPVAAAPPGPAPAPALRAAQVLQRRPAAAPLVPPVPPPPVLLRWPPMASRNVTPPVVPPPPTVQAPPRAVNTPTGPSRAPAAAASPRPDVGQAPGVPTMPATPVSAEPSGVPTVPAAASVAEPAASVTASAEPGPGLSVPLEPPATPPTTPPGAPTPRAPARAASPAVAATVEGLASDDYFELVDRARDLLRVAEFEVAERLLLRALQVRPGDRVVQQNLRVLARRRGPEAEINH